MLKLLEPSVSQATASPLNTQVDTIYLAPLHFSDLSSSHPNIIVLLGRTGLGDNFADSTHGYSCNSFLILYSRS